MESHQRGFTFVEILVTITIVSFLSLTSSFAYSKHLSRTRDAQRKTDIDKIKNTLYEYYNDFGCFPNSLPACTEAIISPRGSNYATLPCPPNSTTPYIYEIDKSDCPQKFKILTNLETENDTSIKQAGCTFGCGDNCNYNYGRASVNERLNTNCVHYFACTSNGSCIEYEDPQASNCPITFENTPDCNNRCSKDKSIRCHDQRGKNN